MITVHLVVKGKVQGVFYRASAKEAAEASGITGWVRNMPDGRVEIMASGTEAQLERFTAWCRKGPSGARVEAVEATSITGDQQFDAFRIIRK